VAHVQRPDLMTRSSKKKPRNGQGEKKTSWISATVNRCVANHLLMGQGCQNQGEGKTGLSDGGKKQVKIVRKRDQTGTGFTAVQRKTTIREKKEELKGKCQKKDGPSRGNRFLGAIEKQSGVVGSKPMGTTEPQTKMPSSHNGGRYENCKPGSKQKKKKLKLVESIVGQGKLEPRRRP